MTNHHSHPTRVRCQVTLANISNHTHRTQPRLTAPERDTENTMARLPRGKTKHPPSHSEAMKAKWQDPEYRAKMAERDNRREELRKADPERFTRTGIPNGMRKDDAKRLWAVAEK